MTLNVQCVECGKQIAFPQPAIEQVARMSIATLMEVAKLLKIPPQRVIMRCGIMCDGCELSVPDGMEIAAECETPPARLN